MIPAAVEAIDVGYMQVAGAANAFLIRGDGGSVLVECGPAATRDTLRQGLQRAGVRWSDIRHVVLTHIHLDHAGAAGHLAATGAQVWVHPFGAPHLTAPGRLLASTRRVHGAAYERFYGDLLAIDASQVHGVADGEWASADRVRLQALHTPGHARHHVAWLWQHGDQRHVFMGDLAGIRVPDSAFIAVPTPPPEFDPVAWVASLQRVIEAEPTHVWLTHGGCTASDAVKATTFLRRAMDRVREETEWLRTLVTRHADDTDAVESYRSLVMPAAKALGVDTVRAGQFLDDAFFRMNLAGARRAFTAPR